MHTFLTLFIFGQVCYGILDYPELLHKTRNQQFTNGNLESNCFYFSVITFTRVYTLVPYCLRSSDVSIAISSSATRGLSFEKLYQLNITSETLLIDRAPLDLIEDYQIFLQNRQLNITLSSDDSHEQFYYICHPPSFGTQCQFILLENETIMDMIFLVSEWKKRTKTLDVLEYTNGTCYEGLKCHEHTFCLDWREICNGKLECLNGQDEELCSELETNECDPSTEYRCKNGHCIPRDFFFDRTADCLDKTDEAIFSNEPCHNDMLWYCEDSTCDSYFNSWITNGLSMSFTCGDGQCIETAIADMSSNSDSASSFRCGNGRNILYSRQLFESTNDCLEHLKCSFKFEIFKLECQSKCQSKYECSRQVQFKCVNQSLIMFPSKPVYDNHVFFIYEMNKTQLWYLNYLPSFICFDAIRCPQYRITDTINGRTCSLISEFKDFHRTQSYANWRNIYTTLQIVFGGCALPGLTSNKNSKCQHSTLFHCSNSSKCISQHRLQDSVIDCYGNVDENYNGTCDLTLPHRFLCTLEQRCIPRRFLSDFRKHCIDGSDEPLGILCLNSFSDGCDILAGRRELNKIVDFGGICDGIEHIHPFFDGDDTDETDCDEYSCISPYTLCNGQWNCPDGRDEVLCDGTVSAAQCGIDGEKFFCIQHNSTTTKLCASVDLAGDKNVDCLGSADERAYCRKRYPLEFDRRYKCLNDSICISPYQICDCHADCPLEDDERFPLCSWSNNKCLEDLFPCTDQSSNKSIAIFQQYRCDGVPHCKNYADEWLCDLMDQASVQTIALPHLFDFEPILPQKFKQSADMYSLQGWYCNRGIPIEFVMNAEHFECLCPPAYYGNRCQYQRKRLNLILELNAPTLIERTTVFKLVIFLVQTSNGTIASHSEEIVYLPSAQCLPKYIIDLLYPIEWKQNVTHYVRINIYRLTYLNNQIEYRGSWFFPIKFEFLPVNRLAAQILLLEKNEQNLVANCKHLPCVHGSCQSYINLPEQYFCRCQPGWLGHLCDIKDPKGCNCAPESLCVVSGVCICLLNRIGSRCYLPFDPCMNHPCGTHGTCIVVDVRALQWYCVCDEGYFGEHCEQNSSRIKVQFAPTVLIPPAIFVHFITLFNQSAHHVRSHFQRIGFHQTETEIAHPTEYLPPIIFIQLFIEKTSSPLHLVLLNSGDTPMFFNQLKIEITNSNRCPYINDIFGRDFSRLPYLRRVKMYQRPCQNTINRLHCFYDDIQICLCNKYNQTDCISFAIANSTARCTNNVNPCENNGECIQDEKRCPTSSLCLCPECTFGSLCQFSTEGYILSLNTILGPYIKSNVSLFYQERSIFVGLSIVSTIFLLGIIDGFCSLLTFSQLKVQEVGRRVYLLNSSITSLLSIIICFIQFFVLLFGQINQSNSYYSCIIIEFLLKCLPIMCDWLHACISIENVSIVLLGISFRKKLSYKIAKYTTVGVVLFAVLISIHDPLYRHLLYDDFEKRTWCVVSYSSIFLKTYDSTINLINFITPFIINLVSSIVIIILTTRIKARANQNRKTNFCERFQQHQHLIMSPILLVILTIPRLAIAFHTTCMKPSRHSYPYLLIIGYFVSYLPYVLTSVIFILPSTTYKQELSTLLEQFVKRLRFSPN